MLEYRYSNLEREGRTLYGIAMPYGSQARIGSALYETFQRGAFGDVSALDVLLNVQHKEEKLIARTGGGGLTLTESPRALLTRADLPQTREADDCLRLVARGILRGQSIEFSALKDSYAGNLRTVERAALSGIGVVARAAYADTTIQARSEIRQLGTGLTGAIPYSTFSVISDSDALRKEGFDPGAFRFALNDSSREISLLVGDYSRPLASRLAGTLAIQDTPEALTFSVENMPDTSYSRDFKELLDTGAITPGVVPFYRLPPSDVVPEAYIDEPEPDNPGVMRRRINQAVLTAIAIQYRPPRGNPGELSQEPVTGARKRLWL